MIKIAPLESGTLEGDFTAPQEILRVEEVRGGDFINQPGEEVGWPYSEVVPEREGLVMELAFGFLRALCPWRIIGDDGNLVGSQLSPDAENLLSQLVKLSVIGISIKPSGLVSDLNLTLVNGWVLEFYSMSELETWELSIMEGQVPE